MAPCPDQMPDKKYNSTDHLNWLLADSYLSWRCLLSRNHQALFSQEPSHYGISGQFTKDFWYQNIHSTIFRTAIISYHFCNYVYVWTNPECTKKLLNFTGKPEHWNRTSFCYSKSDLFSWDSGVLKNNATDRINPLQSVALRYILYCFRYWWTGTIPQLHS